MGYNRNTPAATQQLSISQRKMRENSLLVDKIFGSDHYPFSDPNNGGKHKRLVLPEQGASPTTLAGEYGLFVRDVGGDKFISARPPSDGTVGDLIDSADAFNSVRVGSLKVGAQAAFDRNGNLLSSFNVSSVTHTINSGVYKVNYTTNIPTADYFWQLSYYNTPFNAGRTLNALANQLPGAYIQPDAAYATSITDEFIFVNVLAGSIGGGTNIESFKQRITVKVWYIP